MKAPEHLAESISFISQRIGTPPSVALVLGSGLGDFADTLSSAIILDTRKIPHYPRSSVEGHRGRVVFGSVGKQDLMVFQGRVHFYETGDIDRILYPTRIAQALGVKTLVVTNAAGGISRSLTAGDLMAITDQINLTGKPYRSMSGTTIHRALYDRPLLDLLRSIAAQMQLPLKFGVYAGDTGPSYETAAEVEMIHRLGGDAVGMSTIFETAFAASCGIRVAGISCVTNPGTGISQQKLSHDEVTEVANRVKQAFTELLTGFLSSLS